MRAPTRARDSDSRAPPRPCACTRAHARRSHLVGGGSRGSPSLPLSTARCGAGGSFSCVLLSAPWAARTTSKARRCVGEWACVGGASGAGQMARSHGKFRAECDIAGSRRDHDPSVARAWRGSSASPSDREDYHVWVSVRNGQAAMTRAARERKETEEKEDGDTQWMQSACSQLATRVCARSPSPCFEMTVQHP